MRRYSLYVRQRIISLSHSRKPKEIVSILKKEGYTLSTRGVYYLIKRLKKTSSFFDKPRSGRPLTLCDEAYKLIDKLLQENDEVTTSNLKAELEKQGYFASWATVARSRQRLGWTSKATR